MSNDIYIRDSAIFKLISNEPLCYWLDEKTIELFKSSQKFKSQKRSSNQGLISGDDFRFLRLFWEVGSNFKSILMYDSSIRYYSEVITKVKWLSNGKEICNFFDSKGKLRSRPQNIESYFRPGLSWAKRTSRFEPHIVPKDTIYTSGRYISLHESLDEILFTCSLWNSEYMDYCIKLSMERIGDPKFINGTVNQLPYPDLPKFIQEELIKITTNQYSKVKKIFKLDDKSLAFTCNDFINHKSLDEFTNYYIDLLSEEKLLYIDNQVKLNDLIYCHFNILENEREIIHKLISKEGDDDQGLVFNLNKKLVIEQIFSILIGCVFNRWDMRIIKKWNISCSDEDMFKARKHSPFLFGQKETTLDLILSEYHKKFEQIWEEPYPIETLKENASTKDIVGKLKEVLTYFWRNSTSTIEFEFQDHFGVGDLESIFINPNKFFDVHLKDYSRNKRISPIYWPISTASGSYNIWLYYPKLTDQSLVAIINNYLQPKIDELVKQKKPLELNSTLDNKGLKELNDLNDFEHELEDMKKELLRITALPYKPNHDDGVLITAAPLHNLFRHTKWRKATEDCWKELENGEYDWAHLAYSIWPDRVTEKCKKDLSMAIAHGLEHICEVIPKEKKEKVVKTAKKTNPINKLNFGE